MSPRMGLDLPTILQKAGEIVDEKGLDHLSLGELARRLQIRTPSLYNHIEGLEALRQKLAIHGLHNLHERMVYAAVGRSGDEAVRALSEAYVSFARNHPGLYDATFRAPETDDPELQQAQHKVVELVVQVLQVYGLKDEAALHTVRGFRSILHGFASIELAGGFGLPLDLDKSFLLLIDTFLAGIHSGTSN
ncbi:TetR/AcrR family transcriptional regulator [Paenibacillus abyssi]|uniref:TetR family transcriptional regulator n=1 Tax=Paenibacillus abyssi TaxID=1340531 RepID=A0A917FN81_9BACL|nr:TetR/AcrR family transcriptional regulator [Paenibacillus abyssi]GGF95210.1 TetR family transcriptional regulator [Paenibacillus abyssi]